MKDLTQPFPSEWLGPNLTQPFMGRNRISSQRGNHSTLFREHSGPLRPFFLSGKCRSTLLPYQHSLSTRGVISISSNVSLKYTNFSLGKEFVKIIVVCSSVVTYSSFTALFMYHVLVLDLKVPWHVIMLSPAPDQPILEAAVILLHNLPFKLQHTRPMSTTNVCFLLIHEIGAQLEVIYKLVLSSTLLAQFWIYESLQLLKH